MKTFGKDHRISSRQARDRGDAPPLLTLDEKLEPCTVELIRPVTLESEGRTLTEIVINVPTVDDILNQQLGEQSKQSTLNASHGHVKHYLPRRLHTCTLTISDASRKSTGPIRNSDGDPSP